MSNPVIDNATLVLPLEPNGNGNGHEGNPLWGEPQPLRRELPPPDEYPLESLGPVLSAAALKTREIIQCPRALCGQSFLAAATLAVQSFADAEIDGRTSPLSNDFITIAGSGERKTAADDIALGPVNKRQKDLYQDFLVAKSEYSAEIAAWKKSREEALSSNGDKDEKKKALMDLGPEPESPLSPTLTHEEPTFEGLTKSLATGWPSSGIFSNEGGQFVGGHGMNSENQLKTSAGLSKLWDGSPITRTRSGDGITVLYGKRLTLHLMMQPQVASMFFGNQLLADQGIFSRCLPSYPESTIGSREYVGRSLRDTPEIKEYFGVMMKILETPLPLVEGTLNELQPREISLSVGAKHIWVGFYNHIEKLCKKGGELHHIKGFASKSAEHVARIAGVLSMFENLNVVEISETKIQAGIEIVEFHLGEALRLFNSSADNPDLVLAENLLAWAQAQGGPVYPRKIYQYGPNAIRDKATAERIIHILTDHGWFRPIIGGAKIDGIKRRTAYEVQL